MPYANYLIRSRHRTKWYARVVVPHDVRQHFRQRREIRKTLGTSCKATAKRRAMAVWLAYQDVFDALRDGQSVSNLNPDWGTLAGLTTATPSRDTTINGQADREAVSAAPAPPSGGLVLRYMETVYRGVPFKADFGCLKQEQAALEAFMDSIDRRHAQNPWPDVQPFGANIGQTSTLQQPGAPRLSDLWNGFAEESMKGARQKSKDTVMQSLRVFIETVGDLRVHQLDRGAARKFAKALSDYPARRNAGSRSNLTLDEVKAGGYKAIAERTQLNIIGDLRNFANWLVEIEELESNPFIKSKKPRQKSPYKRKTWTREELALWFSSDLYLKHMCSIEESWKFWLPLLAIYSGARLEEMAALAPTDIYEYEGIRFFEIHGRDGRHIKNASSWRYVPIHSHLAELGFLDYVASRKGEGRLFNLTPYRNEYGKSASKAFGYMRKKLNIEPDFHGYRHTVAETLRLNNVQAQHITWLMGHSGKTTTDQYGSDADKRNRLSLISAAVETLNWRPVLGSVES